MKTALAQLLRVLLSAYEGLEGLTPRLSDFIQVCPIAFPIVALEKNIPTERPKDNKHHM